MGINQQPLVNSTVFVFYFYAQISVWRIVKTKAKHWVMLKFPSPENQTFPQANFSSQQDSLFSLILFIYGSIHQEADICKNCFLHNKNTFSFYLFANVANFPPQICT